MRSRVQGVHVSGLGFKALPKGLRLQTHPGKDLSRFKDPWKKIRFYRGLRDPEPGGAADSAVID